MVPDRGYHSAATRQRRRNMDYGLVLPTMHAGASAEGIEAAAEVAERVGWTAVWTTDHVLVEHASEDEYGRIFEAILTLAHVGARHPTVRLGTSVIVVPQRQAVVLAKELATLDVAVARSGHRRRRDRLGCDRVREPRRGRPVPRAWGLPRRDGQALAPPVGRCHVPVPRPLPRPRGLRVRAAPGPGCRAPGLVRRPSACGASSEPAVWATATTRARPHRPGTRSGSRCCARRLPRRDDRC